MNLQVSGLHEFPARIETPERTYIDHRIYVERGSDAETEPWRARIYAKDGKLRAEIPALACEALGNVTWLIRGTDGRTAWRAQRTTGCGCGGGRIYLTSESVKTWLTEAMA